MTTCSRDSVVDRVDPNNNCRVYYFYVMEVEMRIYALDIIVYRFSSEQMSHALINTVNVNILENFYKSICTKYKYTQMENVHSLYIARPVVDLHKRQHFTS